ncbi:MAG: NADH-quinone oxidoreductase subunit NuoE [Desulfobacterota bacterium]|nr:NADH-quinone oxidoreductase subunit NuoE [Thermodesulfobacteriota bacterium]
MIEALNEVEKKNLLNETYQLLQEFSPNKENLISILQSVQTKFGFIPQEVFKIIANFLKISAGEVFGVATFYNQFRFTPPGKHPVKVCLGTACHVRGSDIILEEWKRRLQISEGEVTPDQEFSLDRVACVGCCALAPVVLVGDEIHGKMSPSAVNGILLRFELEKQKLVSSANKNE